MKVGYKLVAVGVVSLYAAGWVTFGHFGLCGPVLAQNAPQWQGENKHIETPTNLQGWINLNGKTGKITSITEVARLPKGLMMDPDKLPFCPVALVKGACPQPLWLSVIDADGNHLMMQTPEVKEINGAKP